MANITLHQFHCNISRFIPIPRQYYFKNYYFSPMLISRLDKTNGLYAFWEYRDF